MQLGIAHAEAAAKAQAHGLLVATTTTAMRRSPHANEPRTANRPLPDLGLLANHRDVGNTLRALRRVVAILGEVMISLSACCCCCS